MSICTTYWYAIDRLIDWLIDTSKHTLWKGVIKCYFDQKPTNAGDIQIDLFSAVYCPSAWCVNKEPPVCLDRKTCSSGVLLAATTIISLRIAEGGGVGLKNMNGWSCGQISCFSFLAVFKDKAFLLLQYLVVLPKHDENKRYVCVV